MKKILQKINVFSLFQTASKAGSHGLLTYASTSCYGGNSTLTTPCPKVIKHDKAKAIMKKKDWTLQGSCLNYNLERYSCFIADIETGGSLVDGYEVKESRKAWYSDQVLHVSTDYQY